MGLFKGRVLLQRDIIANLNKEVILLNALNVLFYFWLRQVADKNTISLKSVDPFL